jgi:hypothetical protein
MICPRCQKSFLSTQNLLDHLLKVELWKPQDFSRLVSVGLASQEEVDTFISKVKYS